MAEDETPGASARSGGSGSGDGNGSDDRPVATVVAVDPRMRSRRIGVRRDAGRRRLKRLTLARAAAALGVAAAVATRTPLLDVDRVTVTGTERTTVSEVVRLAALERGEPLVSVDAGAVARRVEAHPWVASARVERAWPSTVKILVSERVPVAVVQLTDERAAVVDGEGWVVSIESRRADAPADPAGPLVLEGIDERVAEGERLDEEARAALTVASALAERMPGAVSAVSTDLDAELVDGGFIRFGSIEDIDDKVTAARTVLDDVDTTCLELLDVRVPASPALTRNQRCP